jgi:hypothetical protein
MKKNSDTKFVKIFNLTHLKGGNTKLKVMLRILEKIHVRSETGSGSETEK